MPEHLRSLAVILVLSITSFGIFRKPACFLAINENDYARRRNLWLALTLVAFCASNFWFYILLAGVLLYFVAQREPNRAALYLFVLLALPQIAAMIPGFGGINQFFEVDFMRLLALTVLLPTAYALRLDELKRGEKLSVADKMLLSYLLLNVMLQFMALSLTATMRTMFYQVVDVVLPYYVLSRSLKETVRLRDAAMSYIVGALVISVMGMFEFGRHWLLYSNLDHALGVNWGYGGYLERDETLRASVTTGQPIVLGYVVAVAFGLLLYARMLVRQRTLVFAAFALLVGGLIAALSRGPWVGAVVMLMVYLASGRQAASNMSKLLLVAIMLLPVLYMTPYWEKLINYLPFVGEIDAGNVTYRQMLFDVSIQIILENPLFGSPDFIYYMEELRQGQGIIDIVNSYLPIALRSGFVGLLLFLGFFGVIMAGIVRRIRRCPADSEEQQIGRALLATLVGTLVTIATVSSINAIPVVYWALAGMGWAYARMPDTMSAKS
jgi:O-antigen ligase